MENGLGRFLVIDHWANMYESWWNVPVIPTLREVEADAYGYLWLHCEFKVSLGYNEISKSGGVV